MEEGARVTVVDRDAAALKSLKGEFPGIFPLTADLALPASCHETIAQTLSHFGVLDVLVNNAGLNDAVGLDQSPDNFLQSIQRNLVPAFALAHFAAEAIKASRGSIVNVGSKVAETGQGNTSGYAAAKGGINALTREWAVALAPHGVRVNCVVPAECDTPQYQRWFAAQPNPDAARKQIEELVPLGSRLTSPDEVAAMIVFLASPRSGHTTGQIIHVDGGYAHLDRAVTSSRHKW